MGRGVSPLPIRVGVAPLGLPIPVNGFLEPRWEWEWWEWREWRGLDFGHPLSSSSAQ